MSKEWFEDYEKYDELYKLEPHDLIHRIYLLERDLNGYARIGDDLLKIIYELDEKTKILEDIVEIKNEKLSKLSTENSRLEKALVKVCKRLEKISEITINADYDELRHLTSIYGMHVNKEVWKRWSMKDG